MWIWIHVFSESTDIDLDTAKVQVSIYFRIWILLYLSPGDEWGSCSN